uniref:Uncharacterized protein n=1 Tax=Rhizophora mucronata TaxID=61149 RepID=A0A2P2QZB2_RHIMU
MGQNMVETSIPCWLKCSHISISQTMACLKLVMHLCNFHLEYFYIDFLFFPFIFFPELCSKHPPWGGAVGQVAKLVIIIFYFKYFLCLSTKIMFVIVIPNFFDSFSTGTIKKMEKIDLLVFLPFCLSVIETLISGND